MARAQVVLVHGIRTSATMWRNQLAPLARHDLDVVAVDLPAHGSRMGEEFSLEAADSAIGDALDAARPGVPRLLVGLSLGGYLSIDFAGRHPDRLDGLVAASCGTRPRGLPLAGYLRLAAAIGRMPDRGRALNDRMARLALSESAVQDVAAGGVALDVMVPALTAVGGLDPEASLARIQCPVWLVNGRYDHFRIEERRMLRAARDARLVVIPGATHLVSLVRPEEFTAVVLGAVAEVERRSAVRRRAVIGA
ncbi:alpha/beta fold hydrolase [Agromyces sp. LHK192]|uniref:alpha/beta fold hydrolase n=1 Tax=Agromyces sp. LHK192 TaxID=2498704 RepID=UPI000FD9C708|nr:alpha/beta hydrolase [Agromyces sp. LHK192]